MEGTTHTLASGAKLMVSRVPFAHAKMLQDAVLRELRGKEIAELDFKQVQDALKEGKGGSILLDKAMGVMSSKAVEDALFACAEKAVYMHSGVEDSAQKVTRALFDDPAAGDRARDDYYAICWHIAFESLKPFIKALVSVLSARAEKSEGSQKSSSK